MPPCDAACGGQHADAPLAGGLRGEVAHGSPHAEDEACMLMLMPMAQVSPMVASMPRRPPGMESK
eukprot:6052907-Prorocentrum_lima.AAC.1